MITSKDVMRLLFMIERYPLSFKTAKLQRSKESKVLGLNSFIGGSEGCWLVIC